MGSTGGPDISDRIMKDMDCAHTARDMFPRTSRSALSFYKYSGFVDQLSKYQLFEEVACLLG